MNLRDNFFFLLLPLVVTCVQQYCRQGVNCHLPSCFCSTYDHPIVNTSDIPQMVFFGFDDAVTGRAMSFYNKLFQDDRTNPNGCPIKMTLYISHDYTLYGGVSRLYRRGFEMAVHSVTHTHINTKRKVLREAAAQKENIAKLANVSRSDIVGWRSPFLETAGDDQVKALQKLDFEYDISLTNKRPSMNSKTPWPFTADYGWPFNCQIQPCPRQSHPGFWEFPVNAMRDYKDQFSCAYVDGCYNRPGNSDQAYQYLMDNFLSHYNGNRAPFGFNMHYAWFMTGYNFEGMNKFIQKILTYDDVYILTVKQVLEWMKNPTKLAEIRRFPPWICGSSPIVVNNRPKITTKKSTTTKPTMPTTTLKPTTTTRSTTPTTTPRRTTTTKATTTTKPPTTTAKPTTQRRTTRKHNLFPIPIIQDMPIPVIPHPAGSSRCRQGVNCRLPSCFCAGPTIPGNLPKRSTPQMVFMTFDGSVNFQVYNHLMKLLPETRLNPNGCPAKATFFASQANTFPWYLKLLNEKGMEVGMQGYHGSNLNDQHILNEEMQMQLSELTSLGLPTPKGWRSPNLKPLGDGQFEKVMKFKFLYDATLTVPRERSASKYWPFTLDYGYKENCVIPDCPRMAYPGVWEVPNTPIIDYRNLYICNFVDGCMNSPPTAIDTFNFLWNNFMSHYSTNKAPFGLHFRHIWFSHPFFKKNLDGLEMFLNKLNELKDVYVIPIKDVLKWMSSPTPLDKIKTSDIWKC